MKKKKQKKIDTCTVCGRENVYIYAHGKCQRCYARQRENGDKRTLQQSAMRSEIKRLKMLRNNYFGPIKGALEYMREIAEIESIAKDLGIEL